MKNICRFARTATTATWSAWRRRRCGATSSRGGGCQSSWCRRPSCHPQVRTGASFFLLSSVFLPSYYYSYEEVMMLLLSWKGISAFECFHSRVHSPVQSVFEEDTLFFALVVVVDIQFEIPSTHWHWLHCTMEMYGDKLEFLIKALWIAHFR